MARRLVGAAAAQIERAAPLEEEQAAVAPLVGSSPPSSNGGFVRGRWWWWWWPALHPVSRPAGQDQATQWKSAARKERPCTRCTWTSTSVHKLGYFLQIQDLRSLGLEY